jgi:hypothetical protein
MEQLLNGVSRRRRDDVEPRLVQLGAFLRSRRQRLPPAAVGLHPVAARRRAAGLRREEVAALAGISLAWYASLEQGRAVHPSAQALCAVANTLRLCSTEREYVYRLARVPLPGVAGNVPCLADGVSCSAVRCGRENQHFQGLRSLVRALAATPALLVNCYWDVIGSNAALDTLISELGFAHAEAKSTSNNLIRYVLTSPSLRACVPDWERTARAAVSGLRGSLAHLWAERSDSGRADRLITELEQTSPEFRTWWHAHDIWNADRPIRQEFLHPRLGPLAFDITPLNVRSAPHMLLFVFVPADVRTTSHLLGQPRARLAGTAPSAGRTTGCI